MTHFPLIKHEGHRNYVSKASLINFHGNEKTEKVHKSSHCAPNEKQIYFVNLLQPHFLIH